MLWKTEPDNYQDTVMKIEVDVKDFVISELAVFRKSNDSKSLTDSIICNIATFDLSALTTERGYNQIINLLSDQYVQLVPRRIRQLEHTLRIRYGEVVDVASKNSIKGLIDVYHVPKKRLKELLKTVDGIWLIPFLRKAFFDVMADIDAATAQ